MLVLVGEDRVQFGLAGGAQRTLGDVDGGPQQAGAERAEQAAGEDAYRGARIQAPQRTGRRRRNARLARTWRASDAARAHDHHPVDEADRDQHDAVSVQVE